jgi:GR25 family glycosyltransferase involved in LPS biosynthesis
MKYTGFYINLDRSEDRRKKIEGELKRCSLGGLYTRFRASDGNELNFPNPILKNSEIGCFTSHYRLLKENRNSTKPLHIIEDDVILSKFVASVLDQAIDSEEFQKFDIVFTDIAMSLVDLNFIQFKHYYDNNVKRNKAGAIESLTFSVINLHKISFCTTCSFIVNPHAIEKLLYYYEQILTRGTRSPIDLFLLSCVREGNIKAGCLFPFVTSVSPENCFESTIQDRQDLKTIYASNLLRSSFFVECDLDRCLEGANRVLLQPDSFDKHSQLLLRLVGFLLTQEYGKS